MHLDLLSLLFLTFSALDWLPTRKNKKLLHTVANPARGLLNRERKKEKKSGSSPPPHPRCSFGGNKNENHAIHPHVCLDVTQVGVTQVSVRLTSVQGLLRFVG